MKKIITSLIVGFISLSLITAQTIKLNKGDKFTYRTSSYSHKDQQSAVTELIDVNESFDCQQISFKVIEVLSHQYKLMAQYETIQHYNRSKKGREEQWRSGNNYDRSLKNQYTNYYWPDYRIEFILSEKGEIIKADVINVEYSDIRNHLADTALVRIFKGTIEGFFYNYPKKLISGKTIEIRNKSYVISEVNEGQAKFTSIESNNTPLYQLKYDLDKGLLLERNVYEDVHGKVETIKYVDPQKEDIVYKMDERKISRTNLIVVNKEPYYTHKYQKNEYVKDSTLNKTNVTIRGKIINPTSDRNVSIEWAESVPNAYNKYGINATLADDNTFELRFYIDNLRKVTFRQYELAYFYLTPGDDLYITVDMNAFDETIKATGVGSDKLNYSFKKFLFEELDRLSSKNIYQKARENYVDLTPLEFKTHFLDILNKKEEFLNSNCKWLAPEQYLAEFWDNRTTIVSVFRSYPESQKYYRKQADKEPYEIDRKEFFNSKFYSLIHPDNDMMAYDDNYDHFIREYVFFFLDSKMNELTGKGNVITVNNYYDSHYYSDYGFSNSFFTGMTQYILKYQTVSNALQQASWDCYVDLYNRFKAEYPNSYKTKVLDEAYEIAKTLAPGMPAFDFELSDFEGNKVKLSDFRGEVVYIDFWSTYCVPCRGSIESYGKEMQEIVKDKDIVLLYVALENDVERPKKFMDEQGITGVQLIAGGKDEALIREKYYFNGIPHHYLIDRDGRIIDREAPDPYEIVKDHSILLNALEPQ